MTTAPKLLGKSRSFGSRVAVYELDDGLQFVVNEQYSITHRRLLFDDVLLVTIHRQIGAAYLIATGAWTVLFFGFAALILAASRDFLLGASIFVAIGLPAFIAFILRVTIGLHIVTVFGRRSKGVLRFGARKKRARQAYAAICAAVSEAQGKPASSPAE